MISSMTGYGRVQNSFEGREVTVEIRSVNHRFFELSSRVPRVYGYLEEKIKGYLGQNISRGKVDVAISVITHEGSDALVEINQSLAAGYINALNELSQKFHLAGEVTINDMSRFSDIFTVRKEEDDEETIWNIVKIVLDESLQKFLSMRKREGQKLSDDINEKLTSIERMVCFVEKNSAKRVEEYRQKLLAKMKEILQDKGIDEQRILTEAAIFAERTAVDEETVRLKSHIEEFRSVLKSEGSIGRKLDFMVQELNREANTIGSKANDYETAQIVVNIKSEIEKIREQIQNIE